MTREEAIAELSYIADEMPSMECADWKEAICIAIKALEQEPCDDVVSREAMMNIVKRWYPYKAEIEQLKALPSVTPQQRTGRWKRISIDKYSEHAQYWYRCDKCGKDNLGNTDFCPNCGAKMEVEE